MEWVNLWIYWMSVMGLTLAITKLYVFKWFRELVTGISDKEFNRDVGTDLETSWGFRRKYFGRLFRCPACTGFWVGLFFSGIPHLEFIRNLNDVFECFKFGLSASFFCIFARGIMEVMNAYTDSKKG